jgi:site-specific recombinase XerD
MARQTVGLSLRELVEGFLFALQADGRTPRTVTFYKGRLSAFRQYATEKGWDDDVTGIDAHHIREFLLWTGSRTVEIRAGNGAVVYKKAKPSTAWHYYRAVKYLFNWAVDEGYLDRSPVAKVHFRLPRSGVVEPYSVGDLKRLLAVCDLDIRTRARFTGLRNKAMLLVFLDSGLRRMEMANLSLSDMDMEGRQLRVVGKGGKVRIAPFSPRTAKVLWAWLVERRRRAKTDSLWITEEGYPFHVDGLDSWFDRIKHRAGVASRGAVHKLRHTAALAYLRQTRDPFLLQLFLGHESLEMSRRYTQGLKAEEAIAAHRNGASPVEGLGLG